MARISGAALLVIVALGVSPSSALRCWECSSDHDNRCGDPFQKYDDGFLSDCNTVLTRQPPGGDYAGHRPVCIKRTRRVDSYRTIVQRSCEWGHVSNLQGSACSARDNNPLSVYQHQNPAGAYNPNYPAGGFGGSGYPQPPPGYQGQGSYRPGTYPQGNPQYPNNYGGGSYGSNNYGSGSYGSASYGSGSYGSSNYGSGSNYVGSYGDYCVACYTDACNSAPHKVVVTPFTALAAVLAPMATWFLARR